MPCWLHSGLVLLLLMIVVWRLLLPALREENFGIALEAEQGGSVRVRIHDFAGVLAFAKAFWAGEGGYDVDSHLRITSKWLGRPVERALPFPYSPTMLWVLGPFCVLPTAWAYVLWTLLGVAAVWWMTRPQWAVWFAAAFFSPVGFGCFALGQTAVLTVAGLFFLMSRDFAARTSQRSTQATRADWADALVLWLLAGKPPVALTAGVALLVRRRWRSVALALGLTLVSTTFLAPWLGMTSVREYVHLNTHYDLETADPAFAWALAPETMGNLRALLYATFGIGDSAASRWSSSLWLLALVAIAAVDFRRRLSVEATWGLALLAYLLLCPHVSGTGELHVALLLALVARAAPPVIRTFRLVIVGLVLAILLLPPTIGVYQGPLRLPVVFTGKLLLAALVWLQWVRATTTDSRGGGDIAARNPT